LIKEILNFFGRAICHQLTDRSLYISGIPLSVCARDTGIYIGIFPTLTYLFLFKRNIKITIPTIKVSFFLLLLMMPMIIDGLGSYSHLFESNNEKRLITGICFGFVLPFFLYPLHTVKSFEQPYEPVIKNGKDFWIPLFVSTALGFLFYYGKLSYYLLDSFIIITVIVWFSLCAAFLFPFMRHSFYKSLISVLSSLVFLSCLSWLHAWIQGLTFLI
jgi:uncharacterized membrane protein